MNKKLKIYSILLAIVLVGIVINKTFHIDYIVFGLVLMILSQIILKGKDLKDEQELTI
jgi:hypothetical protein